MPAAVAERMVNMFTGLSAFPLTPFANGRPELSGFQRIVSGLATAGVDSIGALGSTGSYSYLSRDERSAVAKAAVQAAGGVPVIVGVGAVATREVLNHVQDAQDAGAAGVLLPPVSYQPLTDEEVFGLYERVAAESDIPVVVYDNPATTRFTFSEELHSRVAALPHIVSIKLPRLEENLEDARVQLDRLRSRVPAQLTLGISGDGAAARGLLAGCDVWYSVLAGVMPGACLAISRAAASGDASSAQALSSTLDPIWALFSRFGSYRVVSAIAAELGVLRPESLHHPVRPLAGADRIAITAALDSVGAHGSLAL